MSNLPDSKTPRRRSIRRILTGSILLLAAATSASAATFTWNGGAGDDLFGSGLNWGGVAPSPGAMTDLIFDGAVRLTPNNNYTAFDDFHSITFAATAGAFNVGGNAIDIFGKIENYSTLTQTISLAALAIVAGQPGTGEFNPVNGDLVINSANVFTNGNNIRVFGVNNKTVTFGTGTVISQGGGITVEQASKVVLLGANTYTGATTLTAGTLAVGNGTNAGSISGSSAVSVAAGTTMKWDNSNSSGSSVTIANNLSGAGTVLFQGTNSAANQIFSNYNLTGNNTGLTGTLRVNGARIIATSASQLSSAAIDLQTGATALLTGTNTFTNNFTVGNGAGWRDSGFYIGALRLEGNQTLNGNITLNNTTSIVLGDGTGQYSAIGGYSAGTHSLNGVISGPGDLAMSRFTSWNGGATQAVNIILGGTTSNDYTGKTVVDGQGANASLLLQKTGGAVAIPANTQVWFGSGTGGQFNLRMGDVTTTGASRNQWDNQFGAGVVIVGKNTAGNWGRFDLQGTNQTIAGLDGGTANANVIVQNQGINVFNPVNAATLTLNGTGTYAVYGYFRDQDNGGTTNKLNIIKTGAGTQTIGNQVATSINFTGTTTVNQGILAHDTTLSSANSWNSAVTVNAGGEFRTSGTQNNQGAAGGTLTLNGGIYAHTTTAANAWKVWTGGLTVSAASTINVNNTNTTNNNVFFDGGISGAGALTLNTTGGANNGIVFRTTAGSYSGALQVNSGNVFVNGTAGLVFQNSDVTFATGSTLRLDANWAGSVANASVKSLSGAGAVTLSAQLTLGTNNGSGSFSGGVSGTGAVVKTGSGTQTLGGAGTNYTGATTVSQGTLILDGTNALNASAWSIAGGAFLTVNTTNTAVDNWVDVGALTGTGTLTKTGAGWFQFRGAAPANFQGTILINGGRFGNGFNTTVWTSSTADVFVASGAELDLRTDDVIVDELTGSGTVINTFALGETNNTLTVGSNNGSSQFDGIIRGIGGVGVNNTSIDIGRNNLAKIGTGTFTLTGASVYGGATTVSNGILRIGGVSDRLPVGTTLTVNGGATVGGTFDLNALNQTVSALTAGSGAVPGVVTNLAVGTGTLTVSGTSTFDGVIQDGGAGKLTGLTKSGSGTLSLTGTNTHSGTTLITGGALRQASATALSPNSNVNMNGGIVELGVTDFTAALGTGNGQVQFTGSGGFGAFGGTRIVNIGGAAGTMTWNAGNFVPTGSSLILSGPNSDSTTRFLNPIDLNAGAGRITSLGGTAAIDAELAGDITNGTLTLAPVNSTFQITGQINGATVVENGATVTNNMQVLLQRAGGNAINGALQIGVAAAAANTFTTVKLGADEQIADSTVVTIGSASGRWSYLNLNGFNETIAGLSNLGGADGGVVQLVEADASPATNSTLTLNVAAGTQSYFGHIRDRSSGFSNHATAGKLNFVKTGGGTQELTTWNNQTWSGTTAVQQGTLRLILNNVANLPGALSVDAGATLEFAPALANNYTVTGAITGNGTIVKSGTGTTSLFGTVSPTGNILVQQGTLRNDGNSANWSGSTANLDISSGATLDMRADSVTINSLTGVGTLTNSYGNGAGVYDTLTVGVSGGGGDFGGAITDGGSGNGENQGGTALTKLGAGTQILSGTNTYTGVTTITGGILQIGNGGAAGTLGSGAVIDNSTLEFKRSNSYTVANAISGTGAVIQSGTGTTVLTGTNTFTGTTTVSAGTLEAAGAGTLGSTAGIAVNNGGTLLLSGTGNRINDSATVNLNGGKINVGGALEGNGVSSLDGMGALTLSANSTIDFSGVGSVMFASGTYSAGTLSILNWNGSALTAGMDGTNDRLMFQGNDADRLSFLSAFSQSSIVFDGFASGYTAISFDGGHFEVVPVPEPSSVFAAMALAGLIGWRERRKARQAREMERRALG